MIRPPMRQCVNYAVGANGFRQIKALSNLQKIVDENNKIDSECVKSFKLSPETIKLAQLKQGTADV